MSATPHFTPDAPRPIGPYSQAVEAGGVVYISGQIALDNDTGALVGTTIEEQTRRVMHNIDAILAAAGLSLDALVKTTVYLVSMDDFAAFNARYEQELQGNKPARAVVEVSRLPKGALVEIEGIAYR